MIVLKLNSVRIRSNSEVSFTNSQYDCVEIEFGMNSLEFGGIIVETEFARIRANSNSVRIRSNTEVSFTNSHYDSVEIEFSTNSLEFGGMIVEIEILRIRANSNSV